MNQFKEVHIKVFIFDSFISCIFYCNDERKLL